MNPVIPAEPNWYIRYSDGRKYRIIAWEAESGRLIPYAEEPTGLPPLRRSLQHLHEAGAKIVYESMPVHRMF